MKTYELEFLPSATREWEKLGASLREQFRKKLTAILNEPRIASARLSSMPDCYKIKLRAAGYRLVYRVDDDRIVAVGKRERHAVYKTAAGRL